MTTERFPLIADGVRILDPGVGPDTMAVVGAMMSRTPDLGVKFDQLSETAGAKWDFRNPPERVRAFLENNVSGYSHASIASMAKSCFVYAYGFGWPAAWLLTDSMLFDGQEVSTRAVDATKIPGVAGPGTVCRYAPAELQDLHDRWLAHYVDVKRGAGKSGWKFDDARVYLPGTVPTGVVLTNDVRSIARHLDHIRGIGSFGKALSEQVYSGLDALAPVTTKGIGRKGRRALGQWRLGRHVVGKVDSNMGPGDGVRVEFADNFVGGGAEDGHLWGSMLEQIPARERFSTYMDPLWRQAPRLRFRLLCSLAIARDWHRHRPMMPWQMSIVGETAPRSPDGFQLAMAPWYGIREKVGEKLLNDTTRAFCTHSDGETGLDGQFAAMHALPFGTLARLECTATLPDLVYMLELRLLTAGANPEYKAQAQAALEQLCALLPNSVVEAEHLNGGLVANAQRGAMHPV